MRPIPPKLRLKIASNPFMRVCIYKSIDAPNHDCDGRVEWEHAVIYNGKQVNEEFAIVPCCTAHNRGNAMDKAYNRYRALLRANMDTLRVTYPGNDWEQELKYLSNKFMYKKETKKPSKFKK